MDSSRSRNQKVDPRAFLFQKLDPRPFLFLLHPNRLPQHRYRILLPLQLRLLQVEAQLRPRF